MSGDTVAVRAIYRGYGLQGVDGKDRVGIPGTLRPTVEANNPRTENGEVSRLLTVAPCETAPCLIAYDQAYPEEMIAELNARAQAATTPGDPISRDPFRIGHGIVDTVSFDASGRFVLPSYPKKYARIDNLALFISVGPYFEIWDPETLLAERGDQPQIRGLVEHLLEERAGK